MFRLSCFLLEFFFLNRNRQDTVKTRIVDHSVNVWGQKMSYKDVYSE